MHVTAQKLHWPNREIIIFVNNATLCRMFYMNYKTSNWILLVVSLPTASATGRMRIWRALKALGCGALRDSVYLLPALQSYESALRKLADETISEGGSAWLLHVTAQSADEETSYRALFDRSEAYAELAHTLSVARKTLSSQTPQEITRQVRKLRKECEAISSIDYYPNEASIQAEALWQDFVAAAEIILSPGEPQAAEGEIRQLDPRKYQGRVWATRRSLWVDRVASAWLIRRFIDKEARFAWLVSPADCPKDALGFDFDGATFTHVGERVTFEVLLVSFGLEDDPGLQRLGGMVHSLDVGGATTPEAQGFEAILSGFKQRLPDDDHLLEEVGNVLDSLYAHFGQQR